MSIQVPLVMLIAALSVASTVATAGIAADGEIIGKVLARIIHECERQESPHVLEKQC